MPTPNHEPGPLDRCAGHAWIAGTVQAGRRVVPMQRAATPAAAGGADGTISPAASAVEGVSLRNRPSRRATAEEPELSLPHWHLCDTLQPALGARMTGRCAWRYEQRGATRPHSQLPRRRSQLTTVRAAAPSSTTLPPPTPLPSGSAVGRTRTRPRLPAAHPISLGRWLDDAARRGAVGNGAPVRAMYVSSVSRVTR